MYIILVLFAFIDLCDICFKSNLLTKLLFHLRGEFHFTRQPGIV